MLSRIANSLLWMGRYLERSEHLARYAKVHYFSALDAPQSQNKEELLSSILKNAGLDHLYFIDHEKISELNVLFYVLLDVKNPYSIINNINFARENARGARDTISTELWMVINQFYHYGKEIAFKPFVSTNTYDFTNEVMQFNSQIKGLIDNTMVHNDAWNMVSLGIHIERSIQILRIIGSKMEDISNIKSDNVSKALENYQWPILLKSAESFDMCNRFYKATPSQKNTLEFLLLNQNFPKSVLFNVCKAHEHLETLLKIKNSQENKFLFATGKLMYSLKYTTIDEIMASDTIKFVEDTLENINNITIEFEKEYLLY